MNLLFVLMAAILQKLISTGVKFLPVIVHNSSGTTSDNTVFLLLPTLRKTWQADEGWLGGEKQSEY